MRVPVVAIVGRTNVGKSTLFNAISARKLAIVEDEPGVTRDRNYVLIKRFGPPFTLVDTGGLVGEEESPFREVVRGQVEAAVAEADLVVGVLDGVHGPHPLDREVFRFLRSSGKPVIWVANKCERPEQQLAAAEFYSLGIDDLHTMSAAHRVNLRELVQRIQHELALRPDADSIAPESDTERPIKVAVLGKPNVGKSTLINRILGRERVISSPVSGTTRDSIRIPLKREGREYIIFDTAGLRKRARVSDRTVERYSSLRALRTLAECDVAVVVLDAADGAPAEQDAKIAGLAHERGRGLVIVVNKWDAVEKDRGAMAEYEAAVRNVLKFAPYAPIIFVSALKGKRCPMILRKVSEIFDTGQTRLQTSVLNRLIEEAVRRRPPPVYRAEPVKFLFAAQTDVAPPRIVLFANHPKCINFSYERYLKNAIRERFPFEGYDIKLELKKRSKAEQGKRAAR